MYVHTCQDWQESHITIEHHQTRYELIVSMLHAAAWGGKPVEPANKLDRRFGVAVPCLRTRGGAVQHVAIDPRGTTASGYVSRQIQAQSKPRG